MIIVIIGPSNERDRNLIFLLLLTFSFPVVPSDSLAYLDRGVQAGRLRLRQVLHIQLAGLPPALRSRQIGSLVLPRCRSTKEASPSSRLDCSRLRRRLQRAILVRIAVLGHIPESD